MRRSVSMRTVFTFLLSVPLLGLAAFTLYTEECHAQDAPRLQAAVQTPGAATSENRNQPGDSSIAMDGAAWDLRSNMGYAFEDRGQLKSYRLGTNNAANLLKGARRVPKGTLFFVGANGQLYMRTGPYLDNSGKFSFGPS